MNDLQIEYEMETEQDTQKIDGEVTGNIDSEFWGIEKGKTYQVTQIHWRNGEHHFMVEGLGERSIMFFDFDFDLLGID